MQDFELPLMQLLSWSMEVIFMTYCSRFLILNKKLLSYFHYSSVVGRVNLRFIILIIISCKHAYPFRVNAISILLSSFWIRFANLSWFSFFPMNRSKCLWVHIYGPNAPIFPNMSLMYSTNAMLHQSLWKGLAYGSMCYTVASYPVGFESNHAVILDEAFPCIWQEDLNL